MSRPRFQAFAMAILIASVFITPWTRDLFVGDETKYSQVIREMRATHTFFLPTLNGTPFTHKPPMHFWAIDLLTLPLGVYSLWAFVLPSLIAFIFLLWLLARIAADAPPVSEEDNRDASKERAFLAAFVCGTSVLIWASAQTARMDISFTAFIALGAWMIWRFLERADFRALAWGGVWLAVATLIKGPMALVIAVVLVLFQWMRRKRLPRGNYVPAIAAMAGLPLLWVVPAIWIGGRDYAHEIVMKQTVGRAVGAWVHKSPPWYYLGHMPGVLAPWFFVALFAVIAVWRGNAWQRFLIDWILAVLVPYSLMSSKLDVYMMALVPPVALLVADFVTRNAADRWSRIAHRFNLATFVVLAIVGIAAAPMGANYVKGPDHELAASLPVRGIFVALAIASVVALLGGWRSLRASSIGLGFVTLLTLIYVAVFLGGPINELGSTDPLIRALTTEGLQQHIPAEQMALYACPNLWSQHDFPRELEKVKFVGDQAFADHVFRPQLIATSRAHAGEIASALTRYQKVAELRMIGKWFDLYKPVPTPARPAASVAQTSADVSTTKQVP